MITGSLGSSIWRYLNFFKDSMGSVLFPAVCLHCKNSVEHFRQLLCISCFSSLQLISLNQRCPTCFQEHEGTPFSICVACKKQSHGWNYIAASLEYADVAKTIVHVLKQEGFPCFAELGASLLYLQWSRLDWPFPDYITYVPQGKWKFMQKGFNHSQILAEALGNIMNRPVVSLLMRTGFQYAQSMMNKHLRDTPLGFSAHSSGVNVRGLSILIIDDVYTTGNTLHQCSLALAEISPQTIYSMALCQAY